jgi:hypothetical protein
VIEDSHPPAERMHQVALGQRLGGVVTALYIHVRFHRLYQPMRREFGEAHNQVHTGQCGQDGGPVCFRIHRTIGAFERPHGRVGVDSDDQQVTELPGLLQVTHVTEMKDIEATVGQHERATLGPPRHNVIPQRPSVQLLLVRSQRLHSPNLGQDSARRPVVAAAEVPSLYQDGR